MRKGLLRSALAILSIVVASSVHAQAPYPVDRVTLVTHSSPGGGSDVFLRDLAKNLGPILKVRFIVENMTGGSGAKAMAYVAKAKPDGSVYYATTPTYIQTSLLSKPEFGYTALEPVAIVFQDPEVIFTRADAPWKSLAEVLEHARRNPGKSRWGAANPASLERIAMERLAKKAGVKAPIVPHEGGGDMMINVLNGTLDIGVGEVQEMQGQLQAARSGFSRRCPDQRLSLLPDVPTVKEQGVDLVVRKFRGLAGPERHSARGDEGAGSGSHESARRSGVQGELYEERSSSRAHGPAGSERVHEGLRERAYAVDAGARRHQMKVGRRIDARDLALGILALIGSTGYLYETAQISASLLEDAVGARGVPLAFGWTMAAVGVILCLRALFRGRAEDASPAPVDRDRAAALRPHVQALGLLAILAAYVVIVPFAGYIPSTALLIGAVAWFRGCGAQSPSRHRRDRWRRRAVAHVRSDARRFASRRLVVATIVGHGGARPSHSCAVRQLGDSRSVRGRAVGHPGGRVTRHLAVDCDGTPASADVRHGSGDRDRASWRACTSARNTAARSRRS
jgi:tripartite-type tricarboxylate transporter receptor subunit TctC